MGNHTLRKALVIVLIALLAACGKSATQLTTQGNTPFHGEIVVGDELYAVSGEMVALGTLTPTPTVESPIPTDTPIPTVESPIPTDTPTPTPTDTPAITPTETPARPGLGAHGWNYALDIFKQYQQNDTTGGVISVMRLGLLPLEDYPVLAAQHGWVGPGESKITPLLHMMDELRGIANVAIYVPEGTDTSPSVPISETIELEKYLGVFVAAANGDFTVFYGPSGSLVCSEFEHGKSYTLDTERIAGLAAMLPDNSFWGIRIITAEQICGSDSICFAEAVREYVEAIHAGNPTVRPVLHISLQPNGADRFMALATAASQYVYSVYAGIDFPSPNDPNFDLEGSKAVLIEVLERMGAMRIVSPTDTPTPTPTITPTPDLTTPVTPTVNVYKNIIYSAYEVSGTVKLLALDVYQPDLLGPLPAIVWTHGGGLTSETKEVEKGKCTWFAERGFVCIPINYRLVPDGYLPTQITDTLTAIQWMRDHAEQYNIDPERIGIGGGSAGAFLSASAATMGKVKAGVALAGIYDFRNYFQGQVKWCSQQDPDATIPECLQDGDSQGRGVFFMCYLNQPECLARVDYSSAITHVSPDSAPLALFIGASDDTPYGLEDHQALYDALVAVGVPTLYHVETQTDCVEHGFMWKCISDEVLAWFQEYLQ